MPGRSHGDDAEHDETYRSENLERRGSQYRCVRQLLGTVGTFGGASDMPMRRELLEGSSGPPPHRALVTRSLLVSGALHRHSQRQRAPGDRGALAERSVGDDGEEGVPAMAAPEVAALVLQDEPNEIVVEPRAQPFRDDDLGWRPVDGVGHGNGGWEHDQLMVIAVLVVAEPTFGPGESCRAPGSESGAGDPSDEDREERTGAGRGDDATGGEMATETQQRTRGRER